MIDISSMFGAKMCDLCNNSIRGIFKEGKWTPLPSTTIKYGGYLCGYTCSNTYDKIKEEEEEEEKLISLNKK